MKTTQIIFWLAIGILILACNKYKTFNGEATISGYAFLKDEGLATGSVPLPGQTIYLNTGNDTSTYIMATKTDQAGFFSFASLSHKKDYIVFARFLKEGLEFKGSVAVQGSKLEDDVENVTLTASPLYTNGMIVLFSDELGGPLPNLPFRVYGSKLAAEVDSAKYAYYNKVSSNQAMFSQFNIRPMKYYFVAHDTIAKVPYKIFDSVTVATTAIARDTVYLKK